MDRITYVLRFHRPPGSSAGGEAPTTAAGSVVTTRLEAAGMTSDFAPIDGVAATLELTFALNGDQTLFFEWGSVTFGDTVGSTLTFASIGAGSIGPPDTDGFSHGAVTYSVEAGSGQFAGASGLITSNFLVDLTTNELIDNQVGVIRLP
jgi:hypothetical protein